MFIDSHVHLNATDFAADLPAVLDRARAAGIEAFLCVGAGYGSDSAASAVALAEQERDIWASVGVHPHDAGKECDEALVRKLATHPRVVAIGETGLDYFRNNSSPEAQERWFRLQIELAREVRKPLIIHSREAAEDCLRILQEMGAADVGGVFHCYSEDASFAQRLAAINFRVSFPGILTFKKSEATRQIARAIPLQQILLETDGPYLAPEPNRGKRCESAMMVATAHMLARLKDLSIEEVGAATSANARALFGFR